MKVAFGIVGILVLAGCEATAPAQNGVSSETMAAQAAYYASLPTPPDGYHHPAPGEAIPDIVMRGIPEGGPGWSFLIKEGCYYYRYTEGAVDTVYPAPDDASVSWNDPEARSYCGAPNG